MSYTVIVPPDDPTPPPPDRSLITPDKIAADLMTAIQADAGLNATYVVTRDGATLQIVRRDGGVADVQLFDTLDTEGLQVISGTVTAWDELPDDAPEGFLLRVAGDPNTSADDVWARFTSGRWQETVAPNMWTTLDPQAMPWALTTSGSGAGRTFTFGPATWDARDAGDDTNNPLPDLTSVDTVFPFEGRLGFTSGPSIVLSASGAPTRVFRATVTQLLPDDPIAVRETVAPESSYHTALQWDGGLYLWSDRAQLQLSGEPALTPTTISVSVASRFENTPTVSPVVIGSSIYFTRVVNGAVRVFEYYRPPGYNMPPAVNELTTDIPTYIAGTPQSLIGDESLGFLAVRTATDTYVCQFGRGQQGQIVSRWHRWNFPGATVHASTMAAGKLYMMVSRGGTLALESLDVAGPADLLAGIPKDASGTVAFTPTWSYDLVAFRDQNGRPMIDGRSTVRNLILHSKDARSGTLQFPDEGTPRATLSPTSPTSDDYRVPVLRTLGPLRIDVSWFGTVTGLDVQGTYTARNKRI